MELIMPAEISGKIMTLIDSAKEKIIIISPYNKIFGWTKLTKRIKEAQSKGVNIDWYIRKNVEGNYAEIRHLGIDPIEIENLHCKIYMNEKSAIVSSMNLLEFSDKNSIDIGYYISNEQDYFDLLNFVEVYISKPRKKIEQNSTVEIVNTNIVHHKFINLLVLWLTSRFPEYTKNINEFKSNYGDAIELIGFKENHRIIFEPKSSYLRIDLRIGFDYKTRTAIYSNLKNKGAQLANEIGREIDFGNQMKRLKIDIPELHKVDYKNWGPNELEKLKPLIEKTIEVYARELK
jgi:hypothetical protein